MTKREPIVEVAGRMRLTRSGVVRAVDEVFHTISRTLAEGERWELRGFGVFSVKTRAARMGRNPRNGELVPVPERRIVVFKPGKQLKELISVPNSTDE